MPIIQVVRPSASTTTQGVEAGTTPTTSAMATSTMGTASTSARKTARLAAMESVRAGTQAYLGTARCPFTTIGCAALRSTRSSTAPTMYTCSGTPSLDRATRFLQQRRQSLQLQVRGTILRLCLTPLLRHRVRRHHLPLRRHRHHHHQVQRQHLRLRPVQGVVLPGAALPPLCIIATVTLR